VCRRDQRSRSSTRPGTRSHQRPRHGARGSRPVLDPICPAVSVTSAAWSWSRGPPWR
jgi:hypothetical protein